MYQDDQEFKNAMIILVSMIIILLLIALSTVMAIDYFLAA
jgi:hypothetical protein